MDASIVLGIISAATALISAWIASNAKKTSENQARTTKLLDGMEVRISKLETAIAVHTEQIKNLKVA